MSEDITLIREMSHYLDLSKEEEKELAMKLKPYNTPRDIENMIWERRKKLVQQYKETHDPVIYGKILALEEVAERMLVDNLWIL